MTDTEEAEEEGIVWIKTEPTRDGGDYRVTVEFSDDRRIRLTPDTAPRYAMTILEAVARAEYDAAVYGQMRELLNDDYQAGMFVADLRKDRGDIDYSATEPLRIVPGVNDKGKPFLHVVIDEHVVGKWTMAGAREHVLTALEITAVADLDSAYFRALVGIVGIDRVRANHAVHDLANYRPEAS